MRTIPNYFRNPGARLAAGLLFLLTPDGQAAIAETPTPAQPSNGPDASAAEGVPNAVEQLARRLQRLEEQNAKLAEQNAKLAEQNQSLSRQFEGLKGQYDQLNRRLEHVNPGAGLPTPTVPAPIPPASRPPPDAASTFRPDNGPPQGSRPGPGSSPGGTSEAIGPSLATLPPPETARPAPPKFLVGDYDDDRGQFVLVRPTDAQRVPFELRADVFTQARYFDFKRSKDTWTDSTGARMPIQSYDSVEVTRNFVQFSGFALDPRLQFTAIMFSSTAINDTVYLGWINYRFSDALDVRVGNWLVPGTREWYESFRYTLGADRLMATTFFRPNISPGIWAQGEPIENVNYVAMLANSLNRFTQGVQRVGSSRAFGGTVWWEPRGDFGLGPSDAENHRSLSPRIGTSLAISREANQGLGELGEHNPEDTIIRLSDGTPLFRPGALGPGVVLGSANVQLWTIDAAVKYRGLGISGEYLLRWIDAFHSSGAQSPIHSLFDHGGLLQAGYFLVPSKLEAFARSSFVSGPFGGGYEVGGGLNWYVRGSREWRITLEVLDINHSPAQNLLTGYRAGESGTLFQLQWFTDF